MTHQNAKVIDGARCWECGSPLIRKRCRTEAGEAFWYGCSHRPDHFVWPMRLPFARTPEALEKRIETDFPGGGNPGGIPPSTSEGE